MSKKVKLGHEASFNARSPGPLGSQYHFAVVHHEPKLIFFTQFELDRALEAAEQAARQAMKDAIGEMMQEEFANWGGPEHAAYNTCCRAVWGFDYENWQKERAK